MGRTICPNKCIISTASSQELCVYESIIELETAIGHRLVTLVSVIWQVSLWKKYTARKIWPSLLVDTPRKVSGKSSVRFRSRLVLGVLLKIS